MYPVPKCDISWLQKLVADHHDAHQYVLVPESMAADVAAYHQIQAIARTACPDGPINWVHTFVEAGLEGPFKDLLPDVLQIPDWCEEDVFEYLLELAREKSGSVLEGLDEDTFEQVSEFIRSPTNEVAESNGVLRLIPNAVELMRGIEVARRHQLAKAICSTNGEPVALRAPVEAPAALAAVLTGRLELWVWVGADSNNMEHDAPDVFVISALLIDARLDGEGQIVGVLLGQYLPTHTRGEYVGKDALFDIMDAHSQHLNDGRRFTASFCPRRERKTSSPFVLTSRIGAA